MNPSYFREKHIPNYCIFNTRISRQHSHMMTWISDRPFDYCAAPGPFELKVSSLSLDWWYVKFASVFFNYLNLCSEDSKPRSRATMAATALTIMRSLWVITCHAFAGSSIVLKYAKAIDYPRPYHMAPPSLGALSPEKSSKNIHIYLTSDHYRIGQSLVICHIGVLSIRTTKLCTYI